MGTINQALFLTTNCSKAGRIVEIGSKNHGGIGKGSTVPFRVSFPESEYVGVDLEDGPGVDVVHNIEDGLGPLEPASFDLAICCSVLEHTPRPWVLASNLEALVKPGGSIYIAVPWVWRYHAYPDDYFRFSWRGVQVMFPNVEFKEMHFSTGKFGEFVRCEAEADNKLRMKIDGRKYLPCMEVHCFGRKT